MAKVKWNLCSEGLPEEDGEYLVLLKTKNGTMHSLTGMSFVTGEDGGWNCCRDYNGKIYNESRIENVFVWADKKELYEEAERMVKR